MLILYASMYLSSMHFILRFMGLNAWVDSVMVASSSLVGGLGMLQCGIRAHIAAWASMGHEEAMTEARLPLPNRGKMRNTRRISKILSMENIG